MRITTNIPVNRKFKKILKWVCTELKINVNLNLMLTPELAGGQSCCLDNKHKYLIIITETVLDLTNWYSWSILVHELIHVQQMEQGRLDKHPMFGCVKWENNTVYLFNKSHCELPWEQEAILNGHYLTGQLIREWFI